MVPTLPETVVLLLIEVLTSCCSRMMRRVRLAPVISPPEPEMSTMTITLPRIT